MINVCYNAYRPVMFHRAAEVLSCFTVLLSDPSIDRLVVLSDEPDLSLPIKCKLVHTIGRPTVMEYVAALNTISGPEDVNVIINSDCFLDPHSTSRLHRIRHKQAYCISRHEVRSFVPLRTDASRSVTASAVTRYNSQDCWAYRGPLRNGPWLDFNLGVQGCDNRLAYEFRNAGYKILDPYLTVRVMHCHDSGVRSWKHGDTIVPEPHAYPTKYGIWERAYDILWRVRHLGIRQWR